MLKAFVLYLYDIDQRLNIKLVYFATYISPSYAMPCWYPLTAVGADHWVFLCGQRQLLYIGISRAAANGTTHSYMWIRSKHLTKELSNGRVKRVSLCFSVWPLVQINFYIYITARVGGILFQKYNFKINLLSHYTMQAGSLAITPLRFLIKSRISQNILDRCLIYPDNRSSCHKYLFVFL